jgi:hypothetical protein
MLRRTRRQSVTVSVDPNLTFESFVVGPENRLAWEAARTAAESPGSAYNPLFIYGDTGLGKTHLLVAIANRAGELNAEFKVAYTPLEQLLTQAKDEDDGGAAFREADLLLVDDLQFLGPKSESQHVLFHLLDHLLMAGKQVALACDRPPLELGQLDDRLLSRFSGGLVVDVGKPNLETRRSILELRLTAIGASLRSDVIDAVARLAIENVRQLKGALNSVLAAQKAENRDVSSDEIDRLLADVVADPDMPWLSDEANQTGAEFRDFLDDVSVAVEEALGAPKWREDLARAILKWEAEGYSTKRLDAFLDREEIVDSEQVVAAYERDIETLQSIGEEVNGLGAKLPDKSVLHDPDRLDELRDLLSEIRRENVTVDEFFNDSEKVIWDWPVTEEKLIESWDDGN